MALAHTLEFFRHLTHTPGPYLLRYVAPHTRAVPTSLRGPTHQGRTYFATWPLLTSEPPTPFSPQPLRFGVLTTPSLQRFTHLEEPAIAFSNFRQEFSLLTHGACAGEVGSNRVKLIDRILRKLDLIGTSLGAKFIVITLRARERFTKMSRATLRRGEFESERGDVPGWVLVVLMTTGLVTAIWTIAAPRLSAILRNSLDAMNGIR